MSLSDRPQGRSHQDVCHQGRRHGFARSPGRDPVRTDHQPHRAFQDPREGQSFAARPAQDGLAAPPVARLPQAHRRGALQDASSRSSAFAAERFRARNCPRASVGGLAVRPLCRPAAISAADCRTGPHGRCPSALTDGRHEGHGRIAGRCLARARTRARSVSPSCSWLSPLPRKPMRENRQCSISIALSSTGVGASSPSRPARSPARPTAPSLATYGETTVLATVVAAKTAASEGIDFLPLTVNYQEKYYAAGRIPGGYFKREGRPTEKETLVSRLIDRPIRPLFADGWRNETQVIVTTLSHDLENDPDIVAHGRRVGGADALRRALHGPDRRRARRLRQQRIRAQPDARRDGARASSISSSPAPRTPC